VYGLPQRSDGPGKAHQPPGNGERLRSMPFAATLAAESVRPLDSQRNMPVVPRRKYGHWKELWPSADDQRLRSMSLESTLDTGRVRSFGGQRGVLRMSQRPRRNRNPGKSLCQLARVRLLPHHDWLDPRKLRPRGRRIPRRSPRQSRLQEMSRRKQRHSHLVRTLVSTRLRGLPCTRLQDGPTQEAREPRCEVQRERTARLQRLVSHLHRFISHEDQGSTRSETPSG